MAQTIETNLISFSRSTVDPVFIVGNLPYIPIQPWQDSVPFIVPINVLRLSDGSFLTYDNGRLFSARLSNITQIKCIVREWNEPVNEDFVDLDQGRLHCCWEGVQNNSQGIYHLDLSAYQWGLAVKFRCVCKV